MDAQNEFFSLSRFWNLLKYDFNKYRLYYMAIIPTAMLAIGVILWISFPETEQPDGYYAKLGFLPIDSAIYLSPWKKSTYTFFFFLGFILFGITIVGNSFPNLKSSRGMNTLLCLPASTFEKYFSQWLVRLFLFVVLYPIVFKISANLAVDIYLSHKAAEFNNYGVPLSMLPKIGKFELSDLLGNESHSLLSTISLFSLPLLGVSILFAGSIVFKKHNLFLGPLSVLALATAGLLLLKVLPQNKEDYWASDLIEITPHLNFFGTQIPLSMFFGIILTGMGSICCWLLAYFTFKKQEV
ncbi:hypothetical protein [Echinicola sp. 20G]|uniref:hypothetical protein n=1 Tax=Echinicola sp. 20G TaxID=2781961 RepID=UPI0019103FEF|nr:hypothetical protein [Echinicola sp. 20G]